jgi:cell wall-associated NlpC family hydrolase
MKLAASSLAVLAFGLGLAACASSGAVPRPFPGAPMPDEPSGREVASGEDAAEAASLRYGTAIVQTALSFRGVPYRIGGSDPSGFDCSGLVQYVFAQHGLALPREVREQFVLGREISSDLVQPGDLLFFATTAPRLRSGQGTGPSHVGLAIGADEFVHAPSTRGSVRVERFSASYWSSRLVGIRRVNQPRALP